MSLWDTGIRYTFTTGRGNLRKEGQGDTGQVLEGRAYLSGTRGASGDGWSC